MSVEILSAGIIMRFDNTRAGMIADGYTVIILGHSISLSLTCNLFCKRVMLLLLQQGGLLVDGFAVFLSGAAGTAPSVSYCMNGFIAISRVASRGSGPCNPPPLPR